MVQLKSGFNQRLKEILNSTRFLMPYSTSHITDILTSYNENPEQLSIINEDLEFISILTNNHCLANDSKEVTLNVSDPKELFEDRVEEKDLFRNFSLDSLSNILERNELVKGIGRQAIQALKNMPLDKTFIEAFSNPQTSEQMNTLFPGLKDNPTMEGFFKCFGEMFTRMNESEDYKQLRKITQAGLGINRDKIYNADDPYKLITEAYAKLKIDPKTFLSETGKNAPIWFDDITNEYLKLDMHGYQEDTVNTKKGSKKTFRNTTDDAFHAAFASTCNFYITNDKRTFEKTQRVYEQIGIDTLVFKPDEFIEYYESFLSERNINAELLIPIKFIETDNYVEKQIEGGFRRSYYVPFFIFDFFNKMIVHFDNSGRATMILLSQIAPTNKKVTFHFEIEKLSPKIFATLGMDSDNLGPITLEELDQDEWGGRRWKFDNLSFRFIRYNGYYQLYYDYPKE